MSIESITDDLVFFLQKWRNADHEDAITLSRSQVCLLLDQIDRQRDRGDRVVDKPKVTIKAAMSDQMDLDICECEKVRSALRKLSNEVLASLPLMEPLARHEFGNTNYAILIQRAEEARALLAESP